MQKISTKTRTLNCARQLLFSNTVAENFLKFVVAGAAPDSWRSKLIPSHLLYPNPTIRTRYAGPRKIDFNLSEWMEWDAYFQIKDPSVSKLTSLIKKGDVVIDIGTNIGSMLVPAARATGDLGQVIGFEPSSDRYNKCLERIAFEQITNASVVNFAIGSRTEKLSLASPEQSNLGRLKVSELKNKTAECSIVSCISLDEWILKSNLKSVNLIKIDIEGYEYHALQGMQNTIKRFRPTLFVEIDDSNLNEQGSSQQQVMDLFDSWSYVVEPISLKQIHHFDAVARPK